MCKEYVERRFPESVKFPFLPEMGFLGHQAITNIICQLFLIILLLRMLLFSLMEKKQYPFCTLYFLIKIWQISADVWFDLSKSFPWGLGTNQKIHSWIEHFLTIREVFFVHFSEMFSRHCNWESSTRYSCALTHSNSTMLWQQLRSFRLLMLAYMVSFKNYVDPNLTIQRSFIQRSSIQRSSIQRFSIQRRFWDIFKWERITTE